VKHNRNILLAMIEAGVLISMNVSHGTPLPTLYACQKAVTEAPTEEARHRTEDPIQGTDLRQSGFDGAYEYSNFEGPKNAILTKFLTMPEDLRNPRLKNVLQHGRIFNFIDIVTSMNVPIKGRKTLLEPSIHINSSDPMTLQTPRANFNKGAARDGEANEFVDEWIYDQYPELRSLIQSWKALSQKNPPVTDYLDETLITNWLSQNPIYNKGLLIFPKPTLWNKIGLAVGPYDEARSAVREFDIDAIAALFHPQLMESRFDDLRTTLQKIAGPYRGRLNQTGVVRTLAQWVLTQYPELESVLRSAPQDLDTDRLASIYGRSLGVFPIEWATGNYTRVLPANLELATLPQAWEEEVLPKLLTFLRGESVPKMAPKNFLLRDPETKKRRILQSGDVVNLSFIVQKDSNGQVPTSSDHGLTGQIQSVIENDGLVVGLEIRLALHEKSGYLQSPIKGFLETTTRLWLSDFDAEDSVIISQEPINPIRKNIRDIEFPENSGEVTLRYGSKFQVPMSVGDFVKLHLVNALDRNSYPWTDLIITGFERNSEGQVIAISGYPESSLHSSSLVRNQNGFPISIEVAGVQRPLESRSKIVTIPLTNIKRIDAGTGFQYSTKFSQISWLPQSWIRQPYSRTRTWYRSSTTDLSFERDSGTFKLQIGRPSRVLDGEKAFRTSVSIGDELYLQTKAEGSTAGYHAARVIVETILFEKGEAIGFTGIELNSGQDEKTWFIKDIIVDHSYIETTPWSGEMANSIPGSYHKREEFTPHHSSIDDIKAAFNAFFKKAKESNEKEQNSTEDIFGYRYGSASDIKTIKDWETEPISFDQWLETYKLVDHPETKILWAYWVLQVTPDSTKEEIVKSRRKLSSKFHPDRDRGNDQLMGYVNAANTILEKYHKL
jgi:hypothetical protein